MDCSSSEMQENGDGWNPFFFAPFCWGRGNGEGTLLAATTGFRGFFPSLLLKVFFIVTLKKSQTIVNAILKALNVVQAPKDVKEKSDECCEDPIFTMQWMFLCYFLYPKIDA